MPYLIKEIFLSLQGEGFWTGRPALFCRFSGCNLWSGREEERAEALCRFCDTEFRGVNGPGGGRFKTAEALKERLLSLWPDPQIQPFVVFTGGEPCLQLDAQLLEVCAPLYTAIETNGSLPVPYGLDWICVSPKAGAPLLQRQGDELKLVYPQLGLEPRELENLEFKHYFLQPRDGEKQAQNQAAAIQLCLKRPRWRLSLQTHKIIGIL